MQIHMTSDSGETVPYFYIEVYKIYSFSDKTNCSQDSKILEGDTNEHYQIYIVHYELLQVVFCQERCVFDLSRISSGRSIGVGCNPTRNTIKNILVKHYLQIAFVPL